VSAREVTDKHHYADPSHRYVAQFAAPWRRAVAGAVDWGLCYVIYVIVSIPLGVVQAVGTTSREDGDLGGVPGGIAVVLAELLSFAPLIAYFAVLLPTSQTFGMRLMDIRSVSIRTGRALSRRMSIVRGISATAMAVGVYIVFLRETSFEKEELDRLSRVVFDAASLLAALGGVSALVMMVTPTRRSLFDRLFGTAVVDDLEAVVPIIGPWGPLNVFDTSHEVRSPAQRSHLRDRRVEPG
jgi:uncharacterized RDD family membrane protein YckC